MRSEAEPWWRQAQADLVTAEVVFQGRRFYAASWFVQQAVEKGLKALYIEQVGALSPRTHDLQFLARRVSVPAALMAEVTLINPAFDVTRYPEPLQRTAPVDLITEELSDRHLEAARSIFQWLDHQLGGESIAP